MLDTPETMCMLLSKVSSSGRDKWSINSLAIRRRHERELDLTDFMHFVNDKILIVSDPIFSKEAVDQYSHKKLNSRGTKGLSFPAKDDDKVHVE